MRCPDAYIAMARRHCDVQSRFRRSRTLAVNPGHISHASQMQLIHSEADLERCVLVASSFACKDRFRCMLASMRAWVGRVGSFDERYWISLSFTARKTIDQQAVIGDQHSIGDQHNIDSRASTVSNRPSTGISIASVIHDISTTSTIVRRLSAIGRRRTSASRRLSMISAQYRLSRVVCQQSAVDGRCTVLTPRYVP